MLVKKQKSESPQQKLVYTVVKVNVNTQYGIKNSFLWVSINISVLITNEE